MTKVVFFGNERLVSGLEQTSAPILTGLIEAGYDVVAIVSHHSDSKSRNQRELEVAEIAEANSIPLFLPNKPSEIIDDLRQLNADVAVLVAYGRIIGQSVIDLFPKGIINIHPSLLPKYRGPTPIEAAILNRDTETGVSIMQLTAGMDEGPVYAQEPVALNESETKFSAYQKIEPVATNLFFETFPRIVDGSLQPQTQDNTKATYSKLLQKSDALIDWNDTAQSIDARIRAFLAWPQSKTTLGTVEVIITEAQAIDSDAPGKPGDIHVDGQSLMVTTGEGALRVYTLKPLGKKEMPVQAFLSGYKSQLGI
jgi:methionyl-tRNA formyltransferase